MFGFLCSKVDEEGEAGEVETVVFCEGRLLTEEERGKGGESDGIIGFFFGGGEFGIFEVCRDGGTSMEVVVCGRAGSTARVAIVVACGEFGPWF